MSAIKQCSSAKCFEGFQKVYSHESTELKCSMKFSIYLPPESELKKCPVLYYFSGLTCTEENFIFKSGVQKFASQYGIIIVGPDTSPRGCNIDGEDDSYDLGSGAGFYVDATESKWKNHYRMYSYVVKELPEIINTNFPVLTDKVSVFGHSMGGHAALICALKNPGKYVSVSAFAPICNPIECDWGKKAFSNYLGKDTKLWQEYDACHLMKSYKGPALNILIDQGKDDNFLYQLCPDNLVSAIANTNIKIDLRKHEGYDHSYYFIATFMEDHIKHHAKFLKA